MSAYSDWKHGTISDEEFASAMRRECMDIDIYDRHGCPDCGCYEECKKQVCLLGYPQCEEGEDKFEDEEEVHEALQNPEFMKENYGTEDAESVLNSFDPFDIQFDYQEWKKERE